MNGISRRNAALALIVIAAAGLGLRLWGIDYGLPHPTTRPDEERIVGRAFHIIGTGDFNPMNYTYPAAMIYLETLGLGIYAGVGMLLGWYAELGDFMMDVAVYRPGLDYRIARTLSALMGTLTIWVVYRLARESQLSRWASLMAASILATGYLHVRDSHFATVDIGTTLFISSSLWFAVRASRRQSPRDFYLAAVFGGLATAAKYNAGVVCLPILMACLVGYAERRRSLRQTMPLLAGSAAIMVACFGLASPYNFVYLGATLRAAAESNTVLYGAETPRAAWTHLTATFPIAYGWVVYLLAGAGLILSLVRTRPWELTLLAFAVPTLWTSLSVRWTLPRYLIFIAPVMAIWGASALAAIAERLTSIDRRRRVAIAIGCLAGAIVCGEGIVRSVQFDRIAARKDTRVLAAEWADKHLPARSVVDVCRGYGAPALNTDRRRARPFEPRIVGCADPGAADTDSPYLVTHDHPMLERYSKTSEALLTRLIDEAQPLAVFQPFRLPFRREEVIAASRYYDHDAFYLPFRGLQYVERGGPIIRIWKMH